MSVKLSDAAVNTASAREVAVANFRRFLQEVLSEARDFGGWVGYDLTLFGGPQYTTLAQTYPPAHQLPPHGQRLWRRLEALIDVNLRDEGDPIPGWDRLAVVVDEYLLWLAKRYSAEVRAGDANPDPGEYDERIKIDVLTNCVELDDVPYVLENVEQVRLFHVLLDNARMRKGLVKSETIAKKLYGSGADRKRVQRLREGLPSPLAALIQGRSSQGINLVLPRTRRGA